MTSSNIAVYSLPGTYQYLKNTTDDALPNYLNSLEFKQSHFLTDVRLALGYAAVVIAGVTFYFDYEGGWEATKHYTSWTVIAYFVLNSMLTLWTWGVEKGKVYVGEFNGIIITFASYVTKHTPIYKLTVRYQDPKGHDPFDWTTLQLSSPFAKWFSADGQFVAKPFQEWLVSEVPVIAKAAGTWDEAKSIVPEKEGKSKDKVVRDTIEPSTHWLAVKPERNSPRVRKGKK